MITKLVLVTALLLVPLSLFGAELSVAYVGGWAPGYALSLDFNEGVLHYQAPTKPGEPAPMPVKKPLKDFKKIEEYCKGLLTSIPKELQASIADDASYYVIEYRDGDTTITRALDHIAPYPPIRYFGEQTMEEEQRHLQHFKKLVDAFVLITFLEDLLEHYTGVKPSNNPPIPSK
ncbi:MAG: hypothetical protein RL693_736 [Verrucomicrobiota bacterium]|jgi:hypothetical protein